MVSATRASLAIGFFFLCLCLVTVGGASKTYNTGDYWSIPSGTKITVLVQPPLRGATLQTIATSGPP